MAYTAAGKASPISCSPLPPSHGLPLFPCPFPSSNASSRLRSEAHPDDRFDSGGEDELSLSRLDVPAPVPVGPRFRTPVQRRRRGRSVGRQAQTMPTPCSTEDQVEE
jgi:hypothetical protein